MHERHATGATVVFSGGGTGGHLYPALALAEALRRRRPDLRVVFLGAERGLEARVLPRRGEEHLLVPVRGVARGGGIAANLGVPWALLRSLGRTLAWFRELRPELVVVTGGYAGAPAGFVARLSRIPLVLQEQNAVPGVTTRLLARGAREVHVAYPEAVERLPAGARARTRLSGNPVRVPEPRGRDAARSALGLDPDRPVVLVVGGSQGSLALNDAVTALVREAGDAHPGFQLLWATGPRHEASVREALTSGTTGLPDWVHLTGYIDDMAGALEAAELAVSRAGAMATSEFLAWGLPSILVPLPTAAADHQAQNARALEEGGCAVHLPQATLDGSRLLASVRDLLADPARLTAMKDQALKRGRPRAAEEIAGHLAALLPPAPDGSGGTGGRV